MMWELYIHLLYPLPVLLLLLLSVPVPAGIRHGYRRVTLRLVDLVLFGSPLKAYPFITACFLWTSLSALSLLLTGLEAYRAFARRDGESPGVLSQSRCLRWRSERNLWISLLAVALWLCVYRIRVLMKECEEAGVAAAWKTAATAATTETKKKT
jgi:hypothetical protein